MPALIGTRAATGLLALAMACVAASTVAATTLLADEAPGGRVTAMALNGTAMLLGTASGGAARGLLLALAGFPALARGTLGLVYYRRPRLAARARAWQRP